MTTPPCRPHVLAGNDLWFDPEGAGGHVERRAEKAERIREAKAVCATCPTKVRDACLQAALDGASQGIWAGTTEGQRRQLHVTQTPILAPCGTPSAAARHRRKGEPLDDPCKEAERAYNRKHNAKRATRKKAA